MFLYKLLRFIARPITAVAFPTKVIGRENFPKEGKAVVVCNHYSTADSVVIGVKLLKKSINCVGKKEAFKHKLVGWVFEKIGAISVDRDAPALHTHKQIMKVLENDDILLIFPEGTRNKEGTKELAPLKPGAALYALKGEANIIPMLYHHKHKPFTKNYLIVGKPINLDQYKGMQPTIVKEEVTALLTNRMLELRNEVDNYVNNRGNKNRKKRKELCC
jgi:1-acyl-sn-glycerol-3-phosphate acyltransferase